MSGTLYLVPTPIGNLSDMTPRAVETLKSVDFIAAEDTRVTVKLLNRFEIKKPLLSYHQHNQNERSAEILERLLSGESCALCTDAGTPAISDPGEMLVSFAAENGVRVVALAGACAAVTALSASAIPCGRFCFEGFIPVNKKGRRERLDELKGETRTMIFYEAPHKLKNTLDDMYAAFGDRRITLARELTKLHEEYIYTTLKQAVSLYDEASPKGEFVLVLEGAKPREEQSEFDPRELLLRLLREGATPKDACRTAAELTGEKKNALYKIMLEIQNEQK